MTTETPSRTVEDLLGDDIAPADAAETLLSWVIESMGGTPRDGQVAMTRFVAEQLAGSEHGLVQAPTGTGKTAAYAVAALLHARRTGKPMVLATASKVLQSQTVNSDLPAIAKVVPDLSWALLKGKRNYACRARVADILAGESVDVHRGDEHAWDALVGWAQTTDTGDYVDAPRGTSTQLFNNLAVGGSDCAGARCPFKQSCHANVARWKAEEVDLVVVNQHVLLLDYETNGALLPHPVAGVIADEAHKIPETAETVYGLELSGKRLDALRKLAGKWLTDSDLRKIKKAMSEFDLALIDLPPDERITMPHPQLERALDMVVEAADRVARAVKRAPATQTMSLNENAGADPDVTRRELVKNTRQNLLATVNDLRNGEDLVVQVIHDRGVKLKASPLRVDGLLRMTLLDAFDAVVGCSATITVAGTFDHALAEMGMTDTPHKTLKVASPFDYQRSAVLYVPTHLPEPKAPMWDAAANEETLKLVTASNGRALLIFSSKRRLKATTEWLAAHTDHRILVQGLARDDLADGDRRETGELGQLLADFAADEHAILAGSLSLAEGVSVNGRSLSLVVIDKQLFPIQTDPLINARRDAAGGGFDGFKAVDLPIAATRMAQAVGRLIRTVSDTGLIAVLDKRLATKGYRNIVLDSLPDGLNRSITFHPDPATNVHTVLHPSVLHGTADEVAAALSPAEINEQLRAICTFIGGGGVPAGPWLRLMVARDLVLAEAQAA